VLHLRLREHGHGERHPARGRRAAAHDQLWRHGPAVDPRGVRHIDVDRDAQAAGVELMKPQGVKGEEGARRKAREKALSCALRLVPCALLLLAGCAAPLKKPETAAPAPSAGRYYQDDGPPDTVPDGLADLPDAVPRDEPFHKYANRPYTVFGQTYVPIVNKDPLKQRGFASWYGRKFQGQKTSSGETYDMFAMTAAHKTLPIPSY